MYSLWPRELCYCTAYVGWWGVEYLVVRKVVECLSSEVCVNVFLVLCSVSWLWQGV